MRFYLPIIIALGISHSMAWACLDPVVKISTSNSSFSSKKIEVMPSSFTIGENTFKTDENGKWMIKPSADAPWQYPPKKAGMGVDSEGLHINDSKSSNTMSYAKVKFVSPTALLIESISCRSDKMIPPKTTCGTEDDMTALLVTSSAKLTSVGPEKKISIVALSKPRNGQYLGRLEVKNAPGSRSLDKAPEQDGALSLMTRGDAYKGSCGGVSKISDGRPSDAGVKDDGGERAE